VSVTIDEYRSHTSCISEAERYEKTVYKGVRKLDQQTGGNASKKTLSKQEKWLMIIEKAAASCPPSLNPYMDQLKCLENIPTQEKKFRNFATNSLRLKKSDDRIVTQIWTLLMEERCKETEAGKNQKETKVDNALGNVNMSDSHHSKRKEEDQPINKVCETSYDNFPSDSNIRKVMKKALKKASKKSLKFKSLRKEVKQSLLLKAENQKMKSELDNIDDNKWKTLLKRIVDENPKKMKMDGKTVQLVEC